MDIGKKEIMAVVVVAILIAAVSVSNKRMANQNNQPKSLAPNNDVVSGQNIIQGNQNNDAKEFQPPLERAGERVTKKPFGIFITPQDSPVQPEKFRGYHTATDFEIFPEELDADVTVRAVCSGKLLLKEYATGYGGVAVQACELENRPITVIYGHLKLISIAQASGQKVNAGDALGLLGAAHSAETGGERKHLHLGFHEGNSINILGYVQNKTDISNWIDPCLHVCND